MTPMHNNTRTALAAAAALTLAAGSAFAERQAADALTLSAAAAPSVMPRFDGTALDEDFDDFQVGLFPQNGWDSNFDPNFTFTDSPSINGVSWQHTSDGSGFADAGFSPTVAPMYDLLEWDVQLNAPNSVYGFSSVDSTAGFINTRLLFETDNTIDVLQVDTSSGTPVGAFVEDVGTFTDGVTTRMGIEVLMDGTLNVFQDGALIFTGDDIAAAIAATDPAITTAGIDSFQFTGFNDVGGTGDFVLLDNFVTAVPEPATAGLLAAAGLGLLRRRRA